MKLYMKQTREELRDLKSGTAQPAPRTRLEEIREAQKHNANRKAYYQLIQTEWYYREQEAIRAKMYRLSEQLRILLVNRERAIPTLAEIDQIEKRLEEDYKVELSKVIAAKPKKITGPKVVKPKYDEFVVKALMTANGWTREQTIETLKAW